MSIRRVVLDVLTRTRLLEISQRVGIEFYSNAPRNEILDSISRAHSVPFKDLLAHLHRDELKLACQSLGLEDTGPRAARINQQDTRGGSSITQGQREVQERFQRNGAHFKRVPLPR